MKAKLDFGAEIDILSGSEFRQGLDQVSELWYSYARGLKHLRLPILTGTVAADGSLSLGLSGDEVTCGPSQGYAWRICRVSVYGLSGAESADLYFGEPGPTRFVQTVSASAPTWASSRGLLLRPGDYLVLSGSGLTAGNVVTMNGEALEAPAEQLYKLIGG